jgi:hypothetical protein
LPSRGRRLTGKIKKFSEFLPFSGAAAFLARFRWGRRHGPAMLVLVGGFLGAFSQGALLVAAPGRIRLPRA